MRPLPTSLHAVAILFIVSGVLSVIEILTALLSHRFSINLGVLTIFIGMGLLRRNPRSLSWALFVTWLGLVVVPLMAVLFLFTPGTIRFFGRAVGQAPPGLGFVLSMGLFALVYWQYKALTSPETRAVFDEEKSQRANG